jgi:CheY-like chemotaxis protein
MVVDDEPLIREVIADILRDEGYSVLLASGGRRMLQMLETELPDLILLDVMMPDGNGREALQRVRAESRLSGIPVVVITTGMGGQPMVDGATSMLEKPFDLDQLLQVIVNTIGPP